MGGMGQGPPRERATEGAEAQVADQTIRILPARQWLTQHAAQA